jgi:hypothetical protein
LKRERSYFSTNVARTHYSSLRNQHLPIGSGAVEASAKHLVQHRMKSLDFLQISVRPSIGGT